MEPMTLGGAAIAAIIIPPIVSFLKNTDWSFQIKQLLSFVVSFVAGLLVLVVDNGVSVDTLTDTNLVFNNFAMIFTASHIMYTQFFEKLKVNEKLEDIKVIG